MGFHLVAGKKGEKGETQRAMNEVQAIEMLLAVEASDLRIFTGSLKVIVRHVRIRLR